MSMQLKSLCLSTLFVMQLVSSSNRDYKKLYVSLHDVEHCFSSSDTNQSKHELLDTIKSCAHEMHPTSDGVCGKREQNEAVGTKFFSCIREHPLKASGLFMFTTFFLVKRLNIGRGKSQ